MLDFRRPDARRRMRSEHRRWALLVLLLGLTVLVLSKAKDPANWRWLAGPARPAGEKPLDTRLRPPPDPAGAAATAPAVSVVKAPPAVDAAAGSNDADWAAVRDDTPFRAAERGAWDALLQRLARPDAVDRAARVTFAQLFEQPEVYRGRAVTLAGRVRRVTDVGPPQPGAARYQCIVQMVDNPQSPAVVYVVELPAGFPRTEPLSEEVEATGLFYKRWAYAAADGMYTAPLVVARTLSWSGPAAMNRSPPSAAWFAAAVAVSAVLALAAVVCIARWGRRPRPPEGPIAPPA